MTKDYYSDDHTIQVGKETNKKTLKIKSKLAVTSYDGASEYITVDESGNVELSGATTTVSSEDGTVSLSDHLDVAVPVPSIESPSGENIISAKYGDTTVFSVKGKTESPLKRYAETKLAIKGSKTYHSLPFKPHLETFGISIGNDPLGQECVEVNNPGTSNYAYLPLEVPSGCVPDKFYLSCATSSGVTTDLDGNIWKITEDKTTGRITRSSVVSISEASLGSGDIFIEKNFSETSNVLEYRDYDSNDEEISFYAKIRFTPSAASSLFIRYWKVTWI